MVTHANAEPVTGTWNIDPETYHECLYILYVDIDLSRSIVQNSTRETVHAWNSRMFHDQVHSVMVDYLVMCYHHHLLHQCHERLYVVRMEVMML